MILATSWHTVEVETFQVDHRVGDVVFLFSFFEESSFVDDSHFLELVDVFRREFFLWEGFFILHVASPLFIREIES